MSQSQRKISRRQLVLAAALIGSLFVPLLLSGVGLFLALWIVVPAPIFALLPLGVGAPEVSPWLIGLNAIALPLTWKGIHQGGLLRFAFIATCVALGLSALPLVQFPAANERASQEIQTMLGKDYLVQVPATLQAELRSQPFSLRDAFRGIPGKATREVLTVPFATIAGVTLRLNVYRPLAVGTYPAIIVIYGGAWQHGTPDNDAAFSHYMAARGYTVVAIDYRHAPQYQFPTQLEDVQTALTFVRNHASEYEIDPTRIAVMGRSAGAHLAMLAAYQPSAPPLRAVVNYYGPVDLTTGYYDPPQPDPINTQAVLRTFLGGTPEELPDRYRQASPLSYVRPALPPSLLVYAGRDHLVQAKFGRSLYEALRMAGNQAVWVEIPWAEHAFDAVFNGVSNQLALYYTERFLAWALQSS